MTRWGSMGGFWAEAWPERTPLAAGLRVRLDCKGQGWSWASAPATLPPGSPEDTFFSWSKWGTQVPLCDLIAEKRGARG